MTPEYEQYRIGQAEAWLEKVRKAVAYAARLEESAAAQYALADGLKAMDYSMTTYAIEILGRRIQAYDELHYDEVGNGALS